MTNCTNDDRDPNPLHLLGGIPSDKYYELDIYGIRNPQIYGSWRVIGTSGGIHGGGYQPNFDHLLIKPNAIFGILRDDSLLTTGLMDTVHHPDYELIVELLPEQDFESSDIYILWDNVKWIEFSKDTDTLFMYSPCCDRFDTFFEREE